jgi:hypothetical protein
VNERISDLLELASDDRGTALGFSGDTVVRRARVRRRRQHGGIAIGLAAAGVAGVLVASQVVGSARPDSQGPAVGPSTTTPTAPLSSATPSLTPEEQAITGACAQLHLPAPVVRVPTGQGGIHHPDASAKIQDTSAGGPRAAILEDWTIDAYVKDDLGLTATFVNPGHTRWAGCDIAAGGTRDADGVWTAPLPTGPVPQSWYGPDGFRHQATSPSWSQVCSQGEAKVCAHELYAGAFARYDGVASARVDAPDGTVLTPVFGRYTYVFRHAEARVDPNRASNDVQALPSMPVTLLDDQGRRIIRYDYYPSYVVPDSCPPTGGC